MTQPNLPFKSVFTDPLARRGSDIGCVGLKDMTLKYLWPWWAGGAYYQGQACLTAKMDGSNKEFTLCRSTTRPGHLKWVDSANMRGHEPWIINWVDAEGEVHANNVMETLRARNPEVEELRP